MDDAAMDALLGWGTGELADFPDLDFELLDSISHLDNQIQPIEDVPDLIPDYQPAAQDTVNAIDRLVGELSTRVTMLEDQLRSERRKREALEDYVEKLQAFLEQFSFSVEQ